MRFHTRCGKFEMEKPKGGLLRLLNLYDKCVCTYKRLSLCYECVNKKGQNYDFAENCTFYVSRLPEVFTLQLHSISIMFNVLIFNNFTDYGNLPYPMLIKLYRFHIAAI